MVLPEMSLCFWSTILQNVTGKFFGKKGFIGGIMTYFAEIA